MQKIFIKLDRLAAWFLFAAMLLYFISGYGMTKGLIDPSFAAKIHLDWLTYVIMVVFTIHTAYATRLALMRWRAWVPLVKIIWALFYIVFIIGFVYVDHYFVKPAPLASSSSSTQTSSSSSSLAASQPTSSATDQSSQKTFTASELASYDGQNGRPSYVAVSGIVYDVTNLFVGAEHFNHLAGTDLTNQYNSRHDPSLIQRYPVVGIFK